ncbi:MAG: DNA recombination protein RmuC [Burkholderiales bacterium]|nr:MAG: DNA recombination protein RmuC [Betaproteobacteria bacterium]TAG82893.1 MAG: DNA recombination protein RmuC [Burkholderiales bacterium]
MSVSEVALLVIALLLGVLIVIVLLQRGSIVDRMSGALGEQLEKKHRAMIGDVGNKFDQVTERFGRELTHVNAGTREVVGRLQVQVVHSLSQQTEASLKQLALLQQTLSSQQDSLKRDVLEQMLGKMAEQARANSELLQNTLRTMQQQISHQAETMTKTVDGRLDQISGKVNERLDEGFKKTNETFANVMARLAVIDEAQKKIDGLTTNVVSLQQVLSDKSARGAFGEVQLEALVRDTLPPGVYAFQAAVGEGREKADCVLSMPDGESKMAIDSKFPLSNYRAAINATLPDAERANARRQFAADVKKHIVDIASKYVQPGAGADSAVMFVPSEAVFAEIIGNHPDIVAQAQLQRVWLTSPTNLMAVLHTVRAVIRDVETRKQALVIKTQLEKLGSDFGRFQERMDKLATHIRQASDDVQDVQISSRKITSGFERIKSVEIDEQTAKLPSV